MKKKIICINCSSRISNLFKVVKYSNLILEKCPKCGKSCDKYQEYDLFIIFLDLMLQKRKAYAHLLYNSNYVLENKISKPFLKFSIIIFLIQIFAILKIREETYQFFGNHKWIYIYIIYLFITKFFENSAYFYTIKYLINNSISKKNDVISNSIIASALILSSSGSIFLFIVEIWSYNYHEAILWLDLYIFFSSVEAVRGLGVLNYNEATLIILIGIFIKLIIRKLIRVVDFTYPLYYLLLI